MKLRDYILLFLLIVAAFFAGGLLGTFKPDPVIAPDPIIKRDTAYIREYLRDTVYLTKTERVESRDTIWVQLPGDTAKVSVPLDFERKTYRTNNYRLSITGYKPELEEIELFPLTKTVTETRWERKIMPPKWQAGLVAAAQYTPDYSDVFIGGRARYNKGAFNLEGTIGFSAKGKAFAEARAGDRLDTAIVAKKKVEPQAIKRKQVKCADCKYLGATNQFHHWCPHTKMICHINTEKICVYYAENKGAVSK